MLEHFVIKVVIVLCVSEIDALNERRDIIILNNTVE